MSDIYTLYVDSYSIKYSIEFLEDTGEEVIRVSIPNYSTNLTVELPSEFKEILEELGWTDKAMDELEKYFAFSVWENCMRIDKETGTMTSIQ